jgi:rubrerythrin
VSIIGELDTINLYEQVAALTQNEAIRAQILDIAKEEKTHIGELQTLFCS